MFWSKSKENAEERGSQIGDIQVQLQSEDNVFHNVIIALERLEQFLYKGKSDLLTTAIGTSRDLHDDEKRVSTELVYFEELALQCGSLRFAASYDDKAIFKVAVEAFVRDLLEWYAGRQFLEYYDEVDASVIPIIVALTNGKNIDDVFQKYVYSFPQIEETQEEKYHKVKHGMEDWIMARHIMEERQTESFLSETDGLITSHSRGNVIDGYKRIIAALTTKFETSAAVKMFYKIVQEYLPSVTQMMPNINEESIDELYANKNVLLDASADNVQEENEEHESKPLIDLENTYPLLNKVVADILDSHGIKYHQIKIEVK